MKFLVTGHGKDVWTEQFIFVRDNVVTWINDQGHPGLDLDSWKDNARPKCAMKRPYWTHLSYEKTLAGL